MQSAGPPAYVFGLLGFGAIGFALPMALISAELACALPYDGGLVAWVNEVEACLAAPLYLVHLTWYFRAGLWKDGRCPQHVLVVVGIYRRLMCIPSPWCCLRG